MAPLASLELKVGYELKAVRAIPRLIPSSNWKDKASDEKHNDAAIQTIVYIGSNFGVLKAHSLLSER